MRTGRLLGLAGAVVALIAGAFMMRARQGRHVDAESVETPPAPALTAEIPRQMKHA